MQLGGAGIQTSDLPITTRPARPPEPQPPHLTSLDGYVYFFYFCLCNFKGVMCKTWPGVELLSVLGHITFNATHYVLIKNVQLLRYLLRKITPQYFRVTGHRASTPVFSLQTLLRICGQVLCR